MPTLDRRQFLSLTLGLASAAALPPIVRAAAPDKRPNILWITCEDTSPWIGCYGNAYATTPNLDGLARAGVRYTRAFAPAPVCSPARSCIVTGLYAHATGTQRLRSTFPHAGFVKGFPAYLRQAGYYCTNNAKTDYNSSDEKRIISESWDECGGKAHWRGRKAGQPFFAVFNIMTSHQGPTNVIPYDEFKKTVQSQLKPEEIHDPAKAPIPPYYPDTPVVRRTMARVYDCLTMMDKQAGELLAQLEADGLAGDTLVFYYGDGGQGIPRGKRTLFDSGLQVPFIIRFPEKFAALAPAPAGATCDRLISFVDLAPAILGLTGLPVPPHMQGTAFLGGKAGPARRYVYGARDRVDEAFDLSRSVRDERFLYIRHYMPDLSLNQPESFSDQSELRQEITRLAREGKLGPDQLTYAGPDKPAEMLFDCAADPWNMRNLAEDAAHRAELERLRAELRRWMIEIRDAGFMPEEQVWTAIGAEGTPWDLARDGKRYPLERILETAEWVGRKENLGKQTERLADPDPTVRYWAAVGLRVAGSDAESARAALTKCLSDEAAAVRIETARVLAGLGESEPALRLLVEAIAGEDRAAALHAARSLQSLGPRARPVLPDLQQRLKPTGKADFEAYIQWSLAALAKDLGFADTGQLKTKRKARKNLPGSATKKKAGKK